MNILLKSRYLLNGYQFFKSHNTIKLIPKQLNANQRVVNRNYSYSTALIVSSQLCPFAAIIIGRIIQKNWPQFRYSDKRVIIDLISDYKWIVLSALGLIGGTYITIKHKFSEETPFTKRRRLLIFNKRDFENINNIFFKWLIDSNKNLFLSSDHRISKRVNGIVSRLLVANKHLKDISDKNWSVYVIKAPKVINAFVLPNGKIFVFSGLIQYCNNDHQIANVLAHEISHTLMIHGNEMMSQKICIDFLHSFVVMLLWIRLKTMSALIWTLTTHFLLKSLITPKRRLIETEADFVGLTLAARACYDVREGSAFLMKMSDIEGINLFSTQSANFRHELMDSYMDSMIKLRECYNCPKLSDTDPRHSIKRKKMGSNVFTND